MLSGDGISGIAGVAADARFTGGSKSSGGSMSSGGSVSSDGSCASAEPTPSSALTIEDIDLAHAIATIEDQVSMLRRLDTAGASNSDRRALLVRTETVQRTLFALSHTWIADLIAQHGLDHIYGSVPDTLAILLRLSRRRASQRIRHAEQYGQRSAITGERLGPILATTATAATEGALDEEHQHIITNFFRTLSPDIDPETRHHAEQQLTELARQLGPDNFKVAARRLFDTLDPDGTNEDEQQIAEQCYFRIKDQGQHGLSKGTFLIDAETRAYLEAAFAKWAKPGMCNPSDATPTTDSIHHDSGSSSSGDRRSESGGGSSGRSISATGGASGSASTKGSDSPSGSGSGSSEASSTDTDTDTDDRARRDCRSQGRRQHDALKTIVRQMLASGDLGTHRGLPVTTVITMSLSDLESATGHAVTATGSLIRMRDAIRMASHAHHYLVLFDDHGRSLHLGRTKRIATADQRIVLIAADRGCTFPGCTRPATWSQVHHIDEWATGGNTDIDTLTYGCDMHHPLIGPDDTDWATTKAGPDHPYPGRTLWHPPTTLDPSRKGRINHYHHPNEYIYPTTETHSPSMQPRIPKPGAPDPHPPPT
ncbi:HNH endonuclease signature motif containing protein [Rhodococcus sp. 1163]|uniref:HNH endonuclease signature motif containing protein n=1 Tax=Rhodococcus sp. 1163 TaxID=1905289 RepID=UPI0009FC1FD4|nr:HNH endonuclease signature motif containing protein [Rhodococcus sp. 1163]